MIALDANIILRLIVQDIPAQLTAAKNFIAKHCTEEKPGYINLLVLMEIFWVLRRFYQYTPERLADTIEKLLNAKVFFIQDEDTVVEALDIHRSKNIGFADALIGLINKGEGADYTVTFDRTAGKLPEFKLLKA